MVAIGVSPARPKTGAPKKRRSAGRVLLGGLVVMACAFASAAVTLRSEMSGTALAVQSDLPAGHTLTKNDLRVVKAAVGPGVDFVPADRDVTVIGKQLTVPLVAGAVLVTENVGAPAYPQQGQAIIGVAVKPGQYPPDLAPGDRIAVSSVPSDVAAADIGTTGTATKPTTVVAVVTKVDRPEQPQNPAVVTLLLPKSDAQDMAAPVAQGLVTLMQISPEEP